MIEARAIKTDVGDVLAVPSKDSHDEFIRKENLDPLVTEKGYLINGEYCKKGTPTRFVILCAAAAKEEVNLSLIHI